MGVWAPLNLPLCLSHELPCITGRGGVLPPGSEQKAKVRAQVPPSQWTASSGPFPSRIPSQQLPRVPGVCPALVCGAGCRKAELAPGGQMEGRPFVCRAPCTGLAASPPRPRHAYLAVPTVGCFRARWMPPCRERAGEEPRPLLFLQALLSSLSWPCLSCSRLPLPGHHGTSRLSSCRSR